MCTNSQRNNQTRWFTSSRWMRSVSAIRRSSVDVRLVWNSALYTRMKCWMAKSTFLGCGCPNTWGCAWCVCHCRHDSNTYIRAHHQNTSNTNLPMIRYEQELLSVSFRVCDMIWHIYMMLLRLRWWWVRCFRQRIWWSFGCALAIYVARIMFRAPSALNGPVRAKTIYTMCCAKCKDVRCSAEIYCFRYLSGLCFLTNWAAELGWRDDVALTYSAQTKMNAF